MLFHNMLTKIKSISYFLGKKFLGGDGFQKLTKQKILQKFLLSIFFTETQESLKEIYSFIMK